MPTQSRRLAHRLLVEIERGGSTLGELRASPDLEALPTRDRALLHELVLGTLRRRGAIDCQLQSSMTRQLSSLDRSTRTALRLGAYQIRFTRVPARAAVNESVELVRGSRSTGFVNAVLRRLAREAAPEEPPWEPDPLGWLTTWGSIPRWLAARWLARLGPQTAVARARALLEPPPSVFRLNPRRSDAERRLREAGIRCVPLGVPGAFRAEGGSAWALAREGVIALQALGSQLAAGLAACGPRVLDGCAAPGGKALAIADALPKGARVVAAESSARRLAALAARVRAWGADNVDCLRADAARPPLQAVFDSVLLDAPCSGLGTLARNPDIRWRITQQDLERQAERQSLLLSSLARLVAPGGRIVYAACSLEPEENELVVDSFLGAHRDFAAEPPPAWAAGFAEGAVVRTTPERDASDGFFAAVLRRCGAVISSSVANADSAGWT